MARSERAERQGWLGRAILARGRRCRLRTSIAAVGLFAGFVAAVGCSSESTNAAAGTGGSTGGAAGSGGSGGQGGVAGSGASGGQGGTAVDGGGSGGAAGAGGGGGTGGATPTCSDGIKNGSEVAVDCGGGCKCDPGGPCSNGSDCKSLVCKSGVCQAGSCSDGVQNNAETDADCGGGACPPCNDLKACINATDCASQVCTGNNCQKPTCSDGKANGAETGVDCGQVACNNKCPDGQGCTTADDCASNSCAGNKCVPATCADNALNGDETAVDCGGSCSPCSDGLACAVKGDCKSQVCTGKICQAPTCSDQVKNGQETDVDCGSTACGKPCGDLSNCTGPADCASGVCTGLVCQVPTCSDGVKNGAEKDIDCGGGGGCNGCKNGIACSLSSDCASAACNGNACGPWQKAFGNGGWETPSDLDVDPLGNLLVSGQHSGTFSFGGPALSGGSYYNAFYGVLEATGGYGWSINAGDAGGQFEGSRAAAFDSAGNIVTLLLHSAALDLGCPSGLPFPAPASGYGAVVAKLGKSGCIWATSLGVQDAGPNGAPGSPGAAGIAVGPGGKVAVALSASTGTASGNDVIVARLDPSGSIDWQIQKGANKEDAATSVAFDAAGDVFVTGWFRDSIDFGAGALVANGTHDAFLAKLAGASGSGLWSQRMGCGNPALGGGPDMGRGLAVDSAGNVVVVGRYVPDNVNCPGSWATGASLAMFVAKYGSGGTLLWQTGKGTLGFNGAEAVALTPSGDVVVGGFIGAAVDVGGPPLTYSGSSSDALVWKLSGVDGSHQYSRAFGGSTEERVSGLVVLPKGAGVVISGVFGADWDPGLGLGTLTHQPAGVTSNTAYDLFVMSLGPLP